MRRWSALFPQNNFQILGFFSSRCFIFRSTQWKGFSMMEFILVKLQTSIVQTAITIYTDFTTYTFWSMSWKLAILKRVFWENRLAIGYQHLNEVAILPKEGAHVRTENSDVFSLSCRPRFCHFIKRGLQHSLNIWKGEWR